MKALSAVALLLFGSVLSGLCASECLEINAQLSIVGQSPKGTNHSAVKARCIVGTNGWFIAGDFLQNATEEYWLVSTNVIERRTITSSMYLEQARDFVYEKLTKQPKHASNLLLSYPKAGQVYTNIYPAPHGEPACENLARAVWLAFCSGRYLRQPGRCLPLPLGPTERAFGCSDKTEVFSDALALPKTLSLYATNGDLMCAYQVVQTTNFFGRSIPLQFRLVQYLGSIRGRSEFGGKAELTGRVTSLRFSHEPMLPAELQQSLRK